MKRFRLLTGDCIEVMRRLDDASVDAIVTDPPYGLGFMGKQWDELPPGKEWAEECLRVLKPGGHLLAFGGSRTYHRLASAVEDAGFEIRDQIMWLYGSGFPKSLNVGKAIDKDLAKTPSDRERDKPKVIKVVNYFRDCLEASKVKRADIDKAFKTKNVAQGWFNKDDLPGRPPAVPKLDQIPLLLEVLGVDPDDVPEDIARLIFELNGRKGQPRFVLSFEREITGMHQQSTAQEVWKQRYLNHTASPPRERRDKPATDQAAEWEGWGTALKPAHEPIVVARKPLIGTVAQNVLKHGTGALNIQASRVEGERWPANIILDKEAGEMLDEQQEGASRFFYCPKASKKERSAGTNKNIHPTVKPVELMRYLCRLVTPPGGVILDPFLGSGSTGCAVAAENNEQNPDWGFIGIEREAEYMDIAKARIKHWRNLKPDAKPDSPAKPVQQMQLGEEVQS